MAKKELWSPIWGCARGCWLVETYRRSQIHEQSHHHQQATSSSSHIQIIIFCISRATTVSLLKKLSTCIVTSALSHKWNRYYNPEKGNVCQHNVLMCLGPSKFNSNSWHVILATWVPTGISISWSLLYTCNLTPFKRPYFKSKTLCLQLLGAFGLTS